MVRRKRAFTLIELLVVIAIIAILAAILFPLFIKVRDQGRAASCKSNMKQMHAALTLYLQDNNDRTPWFPPLVHGIADGMNPSATPNWALGLRRYTSGKRIYLCIPSETYMDPATGRPSVYHQPTVYSSTNYMANGISLGKLMSLCKHTARTMFLREHRYNMGVVYVAPLSDGTYTIAQLSRAWARHMGGNNYAYFDGHIGWRKPSQVPLDPNAPFFNFDDRYYVQNNPGAENPRDDVR